MGTDFPSCGSVRSTSGKKREFPYGWDESLRFLINRLQSFLGPPFSPLIMDDINEMEIVENEYSRIIPVFRSWRETHWRSALAQ